MKILAALLALAAALCLWAVRGGERSVLDALRDEGRC